MARAKWLSSKRQTLHGLLLEFARIVRIARKYEVTLIDGRETVMVLTCSFCVYSLDVCEKCI
jgi:hypothetical protein